MRHGDGAGVGARARSRARRQRAGWPRSLAVVLLVAASACSGGDSGGGGLFAFGRRESPEVDRRFSAGSRTDQIVLDGATAREVAAFELTRARIERWLQAQEFLTVVAEQDPEVARLLQGGGESGPDDPSAAIAAAIERLDANASVRDALGRVGTSPAEFVLTGLAMHQAFLASTPSAPERLRRLAAHNLRVMQRHEALFQRDRAFDPQRYAYLDSLSWYAPGDTTGMGTPYDPYAADTLAYPDSAWDSMRPPADSLGRAADSLRLDSLARTRPPVVDTLPPLPPPSRTDTVRPPRRDSVAAPVPSPVRPPPRRDSVAPLPRPVVPPPSPPPASPPPR